MALDSTEGRKNTSTEIKDEWNEIADSKHAKSITYIAQKARKITLFGMFLLKKMQSTGQCSRLMTFCEKAPSGPRVKHTDARCVGGRDAIISQITD